MSDAFDVLVADLRSEFPELSEERLGQVAYNLIKGMEDAGWTMVSIFPSRGLLISMAIRQDHSFAVPLTEFCGDIAGLSPEEKELRLNEMAKLHEEVVGRGFYRPEKEEEYLKVAPKPD